MNWLRGKKSLISIENKLLIYKVLIKRIWSYGIELWVPTSPTESSCRDPSLKLLEPKQMHPDI